MRLFYNWLNYLAGFVLRIIALFSSKIHLFVSGRKDVFSKIQSSINRDRPVVWIHAASLGEFEQGKPVIELIKKNYPNHQLLLTFFSPSGYEIRKNYPLADVITYLPLDTIANAKKMTTLVKPKLVVFIKYEFWPNYLNALKIHDVPVFLISGIFRKNQVFFKPQGFWMRKHLKTISHFFVQDQQSKHLLASIGIDEVTVAGDTRFDSVKKTLEENIALPYVEKFKGDCYLTVAGSTWPKDEEYLVKYINHLSHEGEKFIIAPHNIYPNQIEALQKSINKKVVLYSKMEGEDMNDFDVFIVDTIGVLSKIYAYADVAYIGGGYTKSGVHNTLEAATYGLPIVIGSNYKKFKEVKDLVNLKGCVSVDTEKSLSTELSLLYQNTDLRKEKSRITQEYVAQNLGATHKIMSTISKYLHV